MAQFTNATDLAALLTERVPSDAVEFDFLSFRGVAWMDPSGWEMLYVALHAEGWPCAGRYVFSEHERHPLAESQTPKERVWVTLSEAFAPIPPEDGGFDPGEIIRDLAGRRRAPAPSIKSFYASFAESLDWTTLRALNRGGRPVDAADFAWLKEAGATGRRLSLAEGFPWALKALRKAEFLGLVDLEAEAPAAEIVADAILAVGEAEGARLDESRIRRFVAMRESDPLPGFAGRIEQFREPPDRAISVN